MTQVVTGTTVPQARLDSWKSIARYIGRSSRTAQRWFSDYGLPVRRVGGDSGPIFAYTDELDIWLRNRGNIAETVLPGPARPILLHSVPSNHESVEQHVIFDFHSSPGLRKGRSSELASLAQNMWETLSAPNFTAIIRLFRDAIDLDPSNAKAFAGLSCALVAGGLLDNLNTPIGAASAEDALRRALEIEPESIEVFCSKAWIKMASERDWQSARRGFDEVLSRRSDYSPAVVGRALLHIAEGRLDEASDLLLESSTQNPLSSPILVIRCWNEYLAGRSASALEMLTHGRATGHSGSVLDAVEALAIVNLGDRDQSIERLETLAANATTHGAHRILIEGLLGYSYGMSGQTRESHRLLHGFMDSDSRRLVDCGYPLALVLLGLNDRANSMNWLKQSYCEGSLWSFGFLTDPILSALRDDPQYKLSFANLNYPTEGSTPQLASAS